MDVILPYFFNCFLLLIPVFVWNLIFYKRLPAPYQKPIWDDVPKPLAAAENIFRTGAFVFPVFLRIELKTILQILGLILYLSGLSVYFFSWVLEIRSPESKWSKSAIGFTAPAWTTIFWLAGIGLIGQRMTINGLPYSFFIYMAIALVFTGVHTAHAALARPNRTR
jgi:hypothetical protein